jgi:hypothetical protein
MGQFVAVSDGIGGLLPGCCPAADNGDAPRAMTSCHAGNVQNILHVMKRILNILPHGLIAGALLSLCVQSAGAQDAPASPLVPASGAGAAPIPDLIKVRPPARPVDIPRTRWQHMKGHALWTQAALAALKNHGKPLVATVPRDIAQWCPAYATNSDAQRRAFWVGYLSTLAKHESTYKSQAVGGGGQWFGLLQIAPATARGYDCNAGSGEALKSGAANLSCGVRIMAHTVARDGVIHGRDSTWRGVSADWGPMRSEAKREDMAGWLRRQSYCIPVNATRPRARP